MLAAPLADRGLRVSRFELAIAAVRAVRTDLLRLLLASIGQRGRAGLATARLLFLLGRANDLRLLHRDAVGSHFGLTDESSAFFDHEAGRLQIALQHGTRLQLA